MDTQQLLETSQTLLAPLAERFETPEDGRLDAYLPDASRLVDAISLIFNSGGWHLAAITGLDVPQTAETEGATEILYHFCQYAATVTLRVSVTYGDPEVPTICGVIPSATLYERELIEMFGVIVHDTPSHERLLLPDDWPDWVYPMRKSFTGLE